MIRPQAADVRFERFTYADAEMLAKLLCDPEIARNITANTSSAAKALACAHKRIAWHNASWHEHGYGAWAVRSDDPGLAGKGQLIGWCGFTEPDVQPGDPEILYGLARSCWGKGVGTGIARAAIDWLFENTDYPGVSAIISARLNPGTLAVVSKLGMRRIGEMAFTEFLPDPAFAADVLAYEFWRLRESDTRDADVLLEQTCYRAGQLASACAGKTPRDLEQQLLDAARTRNLNPESLDARIHELVTAGKAHPAMDWYHVSRESWGQNQLNALV